MKSVLIIATLFFSALNIFAMLIGLDTTRTWSSQFSFFVDSWATYVIMANLAFVIGSSLYQLAKLAVFQFPAELTNDERIALVKTAAISGLIGFAFNVALVVALSFFVR